VLNLVPILEEELKVKLTQGFPALLDMFGKKGVSDIINPRRTSSLKGSTMKRWVMGH
jgi:hypothetical protein